MSDVPQGPGWWQASDYKWYPPDLHPDVRAAATPAGPEATRADLGSEGAGASWASTVFGAEASPHAEGTVRAEGIDEFGLTSPSTGLPKPKRRGRKLVALAAIGCVAALAASLVFVLGGSSSANAAATVVRAVNSALTDKTAEFNLNMSAEIAGISITGSGSGSVDFTKNAMQLALTMEGDAQQAQMDEVYLDGVLYERIPGLAEVVPGKSWVSINLSRITQALGHSSTGMLQAGANPDTMLRLLAAQGNTVVPLGSTTIDGVQVQGYSVTMSTTQMENDLENADLPAWMRQATAGIDIGGLSIKVYIDDAGQLQSEDLSMSLSVDSKTISMSETVSYSDYGGSVSIVPPPARQVMSFSRFLRDAEASATPSS